MKKKSIYNEFSFGNCFLKILLAHVSKIYKQCIVKCFACFLNHEHYYKEGHEAIGYTFRSTFGTIGTFFTSSTSDTWGTSLISSTSVTSGGSPSSTSATGALSTSTVTDLISVPCSVSVLSDTVADVVRNSGRGLSGEEVGLVGGSGGGLVGAAVVLRLCVGGVWAGPVFVWLTTAGSTEIQVF